MRYTMKLADGGEVNFTSSDLSKTMAPNNFGMIEISTKWVNCGISKLHYTKDVEYIAFINPAQVKIIVPHYLELK